MDEQEKEFKVILDYPVTLDDGLEITEIKFTKRPTGKQLREAIKLYPNHEEREIYMMTYAASIKFEAFDLLDITDQGELTKVFSGFLYQKNNKPFYVPVSS